MNETRLFTWLDVESVVLKARYAGKWPRGLRYRVYSDALEVTISRAGSKEAAEAALEDWFGSRYDRSRCAVLLESEPGRQRVLPVLFEQAEPGMVEMGRDSGGDGPPLRPTFNRIILYPLPDDTRPIRVPPPFPDGTPPVVAFYSYKGGVGRTTHLLALVKALSERSRSRPRLLIVDADVEAPGLTWWVRSASGPSDVSFLDLLALAQYDNSEGRTDTLRLVAQYLRQQLLWLETWGGRVAHFFLPAFRDRDQALRLALRPEHLVQVPGQEWLVADLLAGLGRELGTGAVIVDLRAGFSEAASPLLFDPRVRRVVVTSTSSQSVDGTCAVLEEITKLTPPATGEAAAPISGVFDPVVIISLIPPRQGEVVHEVRKKLFAAYPGPDPGETAGSPAPDGADVVGPTAFRIEETFFAEELLHLDSLEAAWRRLSGTGVERTMARLAGEWLPAQPEPEVAEPTATLEVSPERNRRLRRKLAETARQLVMAEHGQGEDFLRTSALEKLGSRFQLELPLAVVMGAKGAGKTFIFLQMLRHRTWGKFVEALGFRTPPASGWILPLLAPVNLQGEAERLVREYQQTLPTPLKAGRELTRTELVDSIRRLLQDAEADETTWRRFWVGTSAEALGVDLVSDWPERELNEALKRLNAHVVVVLDGLEDVFQELPRNPAQQRALRALCQDLPSALKDLPDRRLGLVVFVRKDMARAAIPQNFSQFESVHAPYELRWSPEEALRLAVWLCRKAGVGLKLREDLSLEEAPRELLEKALHPVWGYKLGSPASREAVTANWVLAALSDFGGRLQARDVVRFFRFAAERAQQLPESDGRLLQPGAVRYAIEPCSEEKVKEAQEEIPWLEQIVKDKFARVPDRRVPFRAGDFDLSAEEVRLLTEVGIVLEEEGEFYIPEIYRHGLGFRLEKGARPRVLALMKRALGAL